MAKDPKIGQVISNYKIIRKLGGGGMGVVYLAEDTRLRRTVALKFLPQQLTSDEQFTARFINEAQAASALDHPRIGTIYGFEESPEGELFIAMAYYDGETLKYIISRGPVPLEETINLIAQVCQGLQEAHGQGIIHRDVKPANILVTKDGFVKIVDFGLAKLGESNRLTRTGTAMGTPAYMSPEQIKGRSADHRTDIWSVGVMLYEMLTGNRPFNGENDMAVLYAAANSEPPALRELRADLPAQIEEVVLKAIAKQPEDRFASAAELSSALRTAGENAARQHEQAEVETVLLAQKTVAVPQKPSLQPEATIPKRDKAIPKASESAGKSGKTIGEMLHKWYPVLAVAAIVVVWLIYRSSNSDLPQQQVRPETQVSAKDSLSSPEPGLTQEAHQENQPELSGGLNEGQAKETIAEKKQPEKPLTSVSQESGSEEVLFASKEEAQDGAGSAAASSKGQTVPPREEPAQSASTETVVPAKERGPGFLYVTTFQVRGGQTVPATATISVGDWQETSPVSKHRLKEGTYTVKATLFPEILEETVHIVAGESKHLAFTFGKN